MSYWFVIGLSEEIQKIDDKSEIYFEWRWKNLTVDYL